MLSQQKRILAFIRTSANSTFHFHCPDSLKLIARLRLGLNHPRFHKFKQNFQDTLNTTCSFGTVEIAIHYLLYCLNISNERLTFFNKLKNIDENILSKDGSKTSKVLHLGDDSFHDVKNASVLTVSIKHILSTKCFDVHLYQI